ncbi:8905_t:CDS:2 [Entrophospora sp. SA101]|nr:8905_t:CDS:2 [Entrophospora sp. SA101]
MAIKLIIGGNAKVLMLVNISPIKSSQAETESSLEFGRVAKAAHIGIAKKSHIVGAGVDVHRYQ